MKRLSLTFFICVLLMHGNIVSAQPDAEFFRKEAEDTMRDIDTQRNYVCGNTSPEHFFACGVRYRLTHTLVQKIRASKFLQAMFRGAGDYKVAAKFQTQIDEELAELDNDLSQLRREFGR